MFRRRERPAELDLSTAELLQLPPPRRPELSVSGAPELSPTRTLQLPRAAPEVPPVPAPAPQDVDPFYIHQAAFRRQPERVVELSAGLSEAALLGPLGGLLARAYGALTLAALRAGKLAEALGHSSAMFARVGAHTLAADEERHNRILAQLSASGAPVAASAVQRSGPFSLSAGAPWRLVGLRRLVGAEHPDPRLVQLALAPAGAWLSPREPAPRSKWKGQRLVYLGADGAGELDGQRFDLSPTGARVTATLDKFMGVYGPRAEELGVERFGDDRREAERAWAVRSPAAPPEAEPWVWWRRAPRPPVAAPAPQAAEGSHYFAVAGDGEVYLLVLEDELWCLRDPQEPARWGLRMPVCKSWRRVRSTRPRLPSREFEAALETLGLAAPATRAQLISAYQAAVAALSEDSPIGPEQLYRALKLALSEDLHEPLVWQELSEDQAERRPRWGPMQYILQAQPRPGGGALFSTAAGVFCVGAAGELERAFRVGAPVEQLAALKRGALICAGGSLYVIDARGALRAQLDLPDGARLLVGQEGFMILQERSLTVFDPLGARRGKISSECRLMRCFPTEAGLLIRTEEREICVEGLSP